MPPRLFRIVLAALLVVFAFAGHATAVDSCDVRCDVQLLAIPRGQFDEEINRLRPADFRVPAAIPQGDVSPFDASTKIDTEELGVALDDLKIGPGRKADLIEQYAAVRAEIGRRMKQDDRHPEYDAPVPVPAGIPEEFSDYLQALLWSHNGQVDDARALWEKIAALPADSRKHRGPWAVFMLGRSWIAVNPNRAIGYFRQTREWIGDGPDRLGLASSSLGWEGRALLNQDHLIEAAHVYAEQVWTGDPTAVTSLQLCLKRLLRVDDTTRQATLADPLVRQAMTAFAFCDIDEFVRSNPLTEAEQIQRGIWVADVRNHGVTDPDESDRVGWCLFSRTEIAAAREWIERGNTESPLHHLLSAKLMLSDGNVDGAVHELELAVQTKTPTATPHAAGEPARESVARTTATADLAAIDLSRGRYVDSMRVSCGSDDPCNWQAAAYIAERVLTVGELRNFVDRMSDADATLTNRDFIRHLLARRLSRDGKIDDAMPYFDPAVAAKMKDYQRLLSEGHDTALAVEKRAASLMAAADLCRTWGDALFGIETSTTDTLLTENRLLKSGSNTPGFTAGMTGATDDERNRVLASKPLEEQKPWFFSYKASALAWDAAALLPDNSDGKLDALYRGGSWLKVRDPKAADRFYKAICQHCGATDLGRQCIARGWFAPKAAR